MRAAGFTLLLFGFLWACATAFQLVVRADAISSGMLHLTERRESFTKDEVATIILEHGRRSRLSYLWVLAPSIAMLAGGVLLGFRKR